MSSFFRSGGDVTESGEDSSIVSYTDSTKEHDNDTSSRIENLPHGLGQAVAGSSRLNDNFNVYHQSVLLHALLEERCMNEAAEELGLPKTTHDARVRARGAEKYSLLSSQLVSHGLITPEIDANQHGPLRQRYRDGLSLFSQNTPQTIESVPGYGKQSAIPKPLRNLVTQGPSEVTSGATSGSTSDIEKSMESLQLDETNFWLPDHPLLASTRYTQDFDEFGVLGKGGYGTVYHVVHKLDKQPYAVKKIRLSTSHLRSIQQRGRGELDAILAELHTLARLDHPNIVRYHYGWIEWSLPQVPRPVITYERPERPHARDDHSQGGGILFEDSTSQRTQASPASRSTSGIIDAEGQDLAKVPSRSTIASVSDDEVEFITRNDTTSDAVTQSSEISGSGSGHATDAALTLHIQMKLYPMTLAGYLNPDAGDCSVESFQHCFHLHGSLQLLLAVMDGVEYLHSMSLVHRDLKPGNIFLAAAPCPSRRLPAGAVDPLACLECRDRGQILDVPISMSVCIGDFGLVSVLQDCETPQEPSRAVGTELYRPETINADNHPSLDVFALGIVFFELVWRFSTRMERHETLHKLRREGTFPPQFSANVGSRAVKPIIKDMVCPREDERPSCQEIRARVLTILAGT